MYPLPIGKTYARPSRPRWEWGACVPSDLSEGESVRPPDLLHLQLEGVLVGVMLHDVVVHVHQDPGREVRHLYSFLLPGAGLDSTVGLPP